MQGAEWAGYANSVEKQPQLSLYHDDSRRYEGPHTLIEEGFIEPLVWD